MISQIIKDLTGSASEIREIITGDKLELERDNLLLTIAKVENQVNSFQIELNKIEKGSNSIFIMGWRPFIGWVCGVGFTLMVLSPYTVYVLSLFGQPAMVMPDESILLTVLMGMLGMGSLRTFEKVKGVARG